MIFDLRRMDAILGEWGHPEHQFPSIHIAGTNGKGSVTALISQGLIDSGLKVGMYTSPHLESICERFQINGRPISPKDFKRWSARVQKSIRGRGLTEFEMLTVIAFLWFAEQEVDVAVLETGLGGRLDATNAVKNKLLSVITNIGLDHTEWLGNTIKKIAAEKAGIIKPGVPVITGAQGRALSVIRHRAQGVKSPFFAVSSSDRTFSLPLKGSHQQRNARLAFEALTQLGVPRKKILSSFKKVRWPGRFECFSIRFGKNKMKVILDGAHNPEASKVLVQTLAEEKISSVRVLFGALKDKDFVTMSHILSPAAAHVVTVPVSSPRSSKAEDLAKISFWKNKAVPASSVRQGLKKILSRGRGPVLITGSLYLVGEARRLVKRMKANGR